LDDGPGASDNGAGGWVNLFTTQFMGDDGRAGINRIPVLLLQVKI
jgi:hypothetical protein